VIGGTLLAGESGPLIGSVVGVLVLSVMYVLTTRDGGIRPGMTTIITGGIPLAFVLVQRAVKAGQR
jgi:ribose/xylose/arabinose/galactoside ABC-type transport system permease subunit